jgi:hypothetical protein
MTTETVTDDQRASIEAYAAEQAIREAKFKDDLRKLIHPYDRLDSTLIPAIGEVLAEAIDEGWWVNSDLAKHQAQEVVRHMRQVMNVCEAQSNAMVNEIHIEREAARLASSGPE